MEPEIIPLLPAEHFCLKCTPDVPCFNACCRDLNQFLTPYDILRLKNCLGLTSTEFLKRYTISHTGPATGLPIVALKQDPSMDHQCPFVRPEGCAVYADRPSSCRLYPLARGLSRSRESGEITEHFALLKEPHCQGFANGNTFCAADWMAAQGLTEYNAMNDRMMPLISLKNRLLPGPLQPDLAQLFHLALYDLDNFRPAVFEQDLTNSLKVEVNRLASARTDDVELLKLGLAWIRCKLFGNAV